MANSKFYTLLLELNHPKSILIYKGIVVGAISGILVSVYRLAIEYGTEKAVKAYMLLTLHPMYILPWLLLIAITSWIVHKLIKLEPYAKGSGIPQVKGIVLLGINMKWYSILFVRFVAGILTSFFGLSLGREGPSIQIGAAGAQAFCKAAGKNKVEKNHLITAGAAAGLSAAFSAPLSGIIFSLEEIHRSFSPYILVAATSAALVANLVSDMFFGLSPVLDFLNVPELPLRFYFWLLFVGIGSGLMGSFTNKSLLQSGLIYQKIPECMRPAVALLFALACGLLLPQVLGGGQALIRLAENANEGLSMLCILLLVKLLFTSISFGSGVPGGIFLPILSIGALTGSILGKIAVSFGLPPEYIPVLCVCAMAGAMSGSVKAPITSILLMAEMTGSLVQMLPVAFTAFVALFVSDVLKISPIYEVLLDRITHKRTRKTIGPKRTLIEMPVEVGSLVAYKRIKEIHWPDGLLIVSLLRGETDIVPNGDTQIHPGDYLVVISSVREYEEMHKLLCGLCHLK